MYLDRQYLGGIKMNNGKKVLNKLTIISLLVLCVLTFTKLKENKEGWKNHPIDPSSTAGLENLPIDPTGLENLPIDPSSTAGLENLPIDPTGLENLPIDPSSTVGLEDLPIDFEGLGVLSINA